MKGQGSLEYLVIAVTAVAVAGLVILAVTGALQPAAHQRDISMDMNNCGNSHLWLKHYFTAYNGTPATAPGAISYYETAEMQKQPEFNSSTVTGETGCLLQGKYKLNFSRAEGKAWLETNDPANWIEYVGSAAAASQPASIVATDQFMTTSDAESYCPGLGAAIDKNYDYVFDLKFDFSGVDRTSISSATLNLWEAYGTNDGVVNVSKIGADDFGTNTITGTNEQTLVVGDGDAPASITLPFAITEDFIYLRVKKSTATYAIYCGKDATDTSHRPYIALTY